MLDKTFMRNIVSDFHTVTTFERNECFPYLLTIDSKWLPYCKEYCGHTCGPICILKTNRSRWCK